MFEKRTRPVCGQCGGPNLSFDALVYWNDSSQDFEIGQIVDKGQSCVDCGCECSVDWVEID